MGLHDRVPEARLLRARHLSEHWDETRSTHRYEDPLVLAYAKFLYDIRGMDSVQQERHFATCHKFSEFHSLLQTTTPFRPGQDFEESRRTVYVGPQQRDRGLIKALVMANASPAYIAGQLFYDVDTIATFEHLAWDVRAKLQARGWLHNHVFSGGLYQETATCDFERMCAHAAYTAGLQGVERLLGLTNVEVEEEIELFRAQYSSELSRKALTAIRSLPLNSHTSPEVLLTYGQWQKNAQDAEIKRSASKNAPGTSADLASRLLEAVKAPVFTVAKTTVEYKGPAEEPRCGDAFQRALEAVTEQEKLEVTR